MRQDRPGWRGGRELRVGGEAEDPGQPERAGARLRGGAEQDGRRDPVQQEEQGADAEGEVVLGDGVRLLCAGDCPAVLVRLRARLHSSYLFLMVIEPDSQLIQNDQIRSAVVCVG